MNIKSAHALRILRGALQVRNHPAIGKGVVVTEYEGKWSPFIRLGQILRCYKVPSGFYFDVEFLRDHSVELICGELMHEEKTVTEDLEGRVAKPDAITGATA